MKTQANCFQCKHFYVTWDPKFPKGCKIYGFKTSRMPIAVVRESTGADCVGFEAKTKPKA